MIHPLNSALGRRLRLRQVWHWVKHRRTRLVVAWLVALASTVYASDLAWNSCRDEGRADGIWGHRNIDFSGQWLLAAMFASGEGRHLYDERYQKALLEKAFPREGESADQDTHDPEQVLAWLMHPDGEDSPLSGPLYPPVHGLVFAPLGMLPPLPAFRVMQALNLVLTFLAAWLIQRLTHGRVWMPVALALLFAYPGHSGGFHLGQNPQVSLAILLLGWKLLSDGRDVSGGLVWGLLAYKPVWAVAFFLVPLLTRRWRFAASMAAGGAGLALATLPFTGLQPWLDWLQIGHFASDKYEEFRNWLYLSRDLIGIPRRWLVVYDNERVLTRPYGSLPTILGVLLWISVPLLTALGAWYKRREPAPIDGPGAAFVLLGTYFSCYHFMYYDVLLSVLPVTLLFTRPRWLRERKVALAMLAVLLIVPPVAGWLYACGYLGQLREMIQPFAPSLAACLGEWLDAPYSYPPFETYALLVLWAWCGVQWVKASRIVGQDSNPASCLGRTGNLPHNLPAYVTDSSA